MKKERLDVLLVNRGMFESRAKAQAAVMAGQVLVNEQKIDKPGTPVAPEVTIRLLGNKLPYVSRGGLKLEKALQIFPISVDGKVVADIGASTGGFTDCMLQNGATKVYAVDVGYGQLAWSLRSDERVVNMERTNIRHVTPDMLADQIEFFSVDVSFISLKHIFPVADAICVPGANGVCLVKPQFEAGREKVGKKGVVRESSTHIEVIRNAIGFALQNHFSVRGLDYSPIKGPEGNIEFLIHVVHDGEQQAPSEEAIQSVVNTAHQSLNGE